MLRAINSTRIIKFNSCTKCKIRRLIHQNHIVESSMFKAFEKKISDRDNKITELEQKLSNIPRLKESSSFAESENWNLRNQILILDKEIKKLNEILQERNFEIGLLKNGISSDVKELVEEIIEVKIKLNKNKILHNLKI